MSAVIASAATPPENAGASPSTSNSEKNASSSVKTPSSAPVSKSRSCIVCRSRKVRCDKQSPCSNCRRANIACTFPSTDRPPKWARRLERLTNNGAVSHAPAPDPGAGKVMDRLRNLENLVKELSGQLEQANAATSSPGSSGDRDAEYQRDTSPPMNTSSVQKQFGRMVLQDSGRSRYVSSGFWSKIDDELDGLKMDLGGDESDSAEDEASPGKTPSSTQELERAPLDRHAFLFRHNLSPSATDTREFHPLPSQIPFLLNIFSESVNSFAQIVHMPTLTKMVRDLRGDMTRLTPANEALMFSIYYSAITSMEEDDIMTNFGSSKTDLNLKYRLGLEHALAKADFLNVPDIVLVQAFSNFLCLLRRHDSPRFVWMLTGLLIRMAQALGLQRDGANFEHLTPFEIEMRRRAWWAVCLLDMRSSEDQGMDLTITSGSFDTKIPLNINDADIDPESKQMPAEREGITDMSFSRINCETLVVVRQLMAPGVRDGAAGLEDKSRLLNEIYQRFERGYFQYTTESGNIIYWVLVTVARLVMAKMTLIVFLPLLFSSPNEHLSEEIRAKLLVAAIEVAEYNHALNAEQACRQWRWIYQTYTHWHAIVYLLIEISRRPWSPIVERAWIVLHSVWLIPVQVPMDKNLRIWVPIRKLTTKARKHRDSELNRLRADPQAAAKLEMEDLKFPLPSSVPAGSSVDGIRDQWRNLVFISKGPEESTVPGLADPSIHPNYASQPNSRSISNSPGDFSSNVTFKPTYVSMSGQQDGHTMESTNIRYDTPNAASELAFGQPPHNAFPTGSMDMGFGGVPWLWADTDPSFNMFSNLDVDSVDVNMDLDGEVNWNSWFESAKGMEQATWPSSDGQTWLALETEHKE